MKNKTKNIFGYVFLFIESILLFLLTILAILKITIFDSEYFEQQLAATNYYEKLYKDIKTEMSYYTEQSGFDDTIIEDVFTLSEVKAATDKFITDLYNGNKSEMNYTNIEEKLNNNIRVYLAGKDFKIANEDDIKTFVNEMIRVFDNEIRFMGYTDSISNRIPKLVKLTQSVIIGLFISLISLICINALLFRRKRKKLGILFYTSAFIMLFVVICIINNIDIKNISIYSDIFSKVIKYIVKNILYYMLYTSLGYIFIGLIINILEKEKRRNRRYY